MLWRSTVNRQEVRVAMLRLEEWMKANDDYSTLMGPASFYMGFSPGGGGSSIDVPAGCYIDVPIDNTAPQVQCDL